MTKAPIWLQDLQRKIYTKAKADPSWRFWGLYVHVCTLETLRTAYAVAKANDGAPGLDGVTFDAIEAADDHELEEELGDLLLQVVFHCQLAQERGAFDFEKVARHITDKLVRRHPHVFGTLRVKDVDQVWANWEKIKRAEKHGTRHARPSALDGIPKRMPALLRAAKLVKKAHKAKLLTLASAKPARTKRALAERLFALAQFAQEAGWSAEDLLRREVKRRERALRAREKREAKPVPRSGSGS